MQNQQNFDLMLFTLTLRLLVNLFYFLLDIAVLPGIFLKDLKI